MRKDNEVSEETFRELMDLIYKHGTNPDIYIHKCGCVWTIDRYTKRCIPHFLEEGF